MRKMLLIPALLFFLCPCAFAADDGRTAKAVLMNQEGRRIGVAVFTQCEKGVIVSVAAHSLPPGIHALHIHEAGLCEKPDFKTAGGHFNPFGKKHGLKSPEGPHAGDVENIVAWQDGTVAEARIAPLLTLGEGKNSLFQPGGTSIVIHEKADDYTTDPAGAAGARMACGIITEIKPGEN